MKHRKSIARLLGSFLSRRSCRASLVPFIGGEIWATALAGTDSGDRVRDSSHPQDLVPSSSQEPYLASRPRTALESATVIAAKPPEETPERDEVSSSADGKSVAASAQSQQEQPLWEQATTTQLSDAERQAIADFHSARSYALSRQKRPRRRPTHEDAPSPPPPTEENFYVLETGGMPRPRAFLRKLQAGAGPEVVTK